MDGNDQVVTSKESINYFGLLFMRVFKQCDMYFLELSGVASNTWKCEVQKILLPFQGFANRTICLILAIHNYFDIELPVLIQVI